MPHPPAGTETLIIDDGGVGALLACMLSETPGRVVAWHPVTTAPAPESRRRSVGVHAEWLELGGMEASAALGSEEPEALLLPALRRGAVLGVTEVVWPVHVGEDVEAMLRESERGRLARRLVWLDLPHPPPSIRTPLLDLTDDQIAELLRDLRAPLGGAWWCWWEGDAPCGRCEGCERWNGRLPVLSTAEAGVAAPVVRPQSARVVRRL